MLLFIIISDREELEINSKYLDFNLNPGFTIYWFTLVFYKMKIKFQVLNTLTQYLWICDGLMYNEWLANCE